MTQGVQPASAERLYGWIETFAALTEDAAQAGVTRWVFSPLEREAHDVFRTEMERLGLRVWTDGMGNSYAEKAGDPDAPALGTGSHLDSVPGGGRFDGIAGVAAALEAARLFVESGVPHHHPIRFVVFTGEEGARFGQACIGSKAVAGLWTPAALHELHDAAGVSVAEAMGQIGLSADDVEQVAWRPEDWAAFVELHVEQGSVLETLGTQIGIVDAISGSTRFKLVLKGLPSHTGSTPMVGRRDALVAAASIVVLARDIALDAWHHGTRCTVGKLEVRPGSITTIPGEVVLWVDVRDVDSGRQRSTADTLVHRARRVADREGVELRVELLSDASPVVLPAWLRGSTERACRELDLTYRVMPSGASHDSQMVSRVVPAGMVFVPSHLGLSHVPDEWTESDDLARGVDVLVRTLLDLDARLANQDAHP